MNIKNFRVDIIGLSSEEKPGNQANGTTFYEVDTTDLYIYYKGTWYKQVAPEPEEANADE